MQVIIFVNLSTEEQFCIYTRTVTCWSLGQINDGGAGGENRGVRILFVRADILVKLLSSETAQIEGFYIKMNLYKKKWLVSLVVTINLKKPRLAALRKNLDLYSSHYNNFIVLGDFNVEAENKYLKNLKEKTTSYLFGCYYKSIKESINH